jgi:hypothetical protein
MGGEQTRKERSKIRFVYHTSEDVRPIYVNGAYGGITPKGELICNFFLERMDVPSEEKMPLVKGMPQLDKIERKFRTEREPDEFVMRRDISAVLIIPIQEVANIANWMLDKLKASNIIVEKGGFVEKEE